MPALKPVDPAAYAVVRLLIAAGSAEWDAWQAKGGGEWPKTDPSAKKMVAAIFDYVPRMAVKVPEALDNCPTEADRVDGACYAMRYDQIFSPENRARLIDALNLRTSQAVRGEFQGIPDDGGDLEWWATAIAAGTLIAVGGLPFWGATVVKLAGYLLAAWVAYGFVTPKTPGGKSLAQKYAAAAAEGLDALTTGAGRWVKIGLGALLGVVVVRSLLRGSR